MVADAAQNDLSRETASGKPPSLARIAFVLRLHASRWAMMDAARIGLWTPVAIGVGAGLYFGLKTEPDWRVGAAALLLTTLLAFRISRVRKLFLALMFASLGFVAADWRTTQVKAPQLTRELGIVETVGRIVSVEESSSQRRYVLAVDAIDGLDAGGLPARVRLTWRGEQFDAKPGDRVRVRAGLSPPPPPVAPGAFDFARQLYFKKIGGVGFAVTAPVVEPLAEKTLSQRATAKIEAMRLSLAKRIIQAAPGEGGAIIAAIVTGKRGAISDRAEAALRDAGLAHLLAISGLHMGLATGLVFFAVRFGLAAIEPIALRYPIKKWAAAAALASGLFYLILSGGGWSARRAFIMTAIIFAAVLVDRRALSLRNVAVAAVIILLTTPEALFSPGFQMSFAAVTALIAIYEWLSQRASPQFDVSWFGWLKRYIVALAVTDLIAAIATAPYALFHFNRVALYSLPANMAAMPLMGVLIVPFAVIALILTPFGLDCWAWAAAAWGMEIVLAIASSVSGLEGAVSITSQWPQSAMLALTAGGLWFCLSRAPWRLAGFAAIPLAWGLVATARPPVMFVSPTGLNAAVVASHEGEEKALYAHSTRREKFAAALWEEAAGLDPEKQKPRPLEEIFQCDEGGCVGTVADKDEIIGAVVTDEANLAEDCQRADLIVALFPVSGATWRACDALLIDRRSVWRKGAHSIWIDRGEQIRVQTVSSVRGERPWTGSDP